MYKPPLISIIVPVYNVEVFLDRCVQSIVEQVYSHLEIILVDDGSTDGSSQKCDEWAQKDNRICVVHKENGGLSSARNCGIDIASGEYILFVDSDDWIHKNMIQALADNIDKADIICCGMMEATDQSSSPLDWFNEPLLLEKEQFLDLLVENKRVTSHVTNKLYPKTVFNSLCFPEGKLYEDIRIAHKIFLKVNSVFILPEAYYYYYVRENSISNTVKLKNRLEWMYALKERASDLENQKSEYQEMINAQMAVVISLALVQNSFADAELETYKDDLAEVRRFLKEQQVKSAVYKYATRNQTIFYWLARMFSVHANKGYKLIKRNSLKERL